MFPRAQALGARRRRGQALEALLDPHVDRLAGRARARARAHPVGDGAPQVVRRLVEERVQAQFDQLLDPALGPRASQHAQLQRTSA
ncbi:MAG: hypothetical protein IPJ19_19220 [Planctomycetes bacterium]|nr:hypothetical protein [Planctomycetota bacterium]